MAYNKIILEGHLTKDVEIKYTQSGSAIANTGIAVSKKFKKQDGSQGEKVLFVDLTFFGRSGEIANQYLRKGSHVLIDGELNLDQWTAQDGSKRSKHSVNVREMQMLGSKDEAKPVPDTQPSQPAQNNYSQPEPQERPNQQAAIPSIDVDEESIPFAPCKVV